MKHTKGEWIVKKEPLFTTYHLDISAMGLKSIPNEEGDANAKLIAAAPELLEALCIVWDKVSLVNALDEEQFEKVFTAIEKATL